MVCLKKMLIRMKNRFKPLNTEQKMTIQLFLGCFLAIVGVVLLFLSFFYPPLGVIDASVLTALGEVFTFSGALIGIDYSYRYKSFKIRHTNNIETEEEVDDE
ncbi:MAG: hypothetical protein VZR10_05470 [Methanobrevibacter sp.]|nr:hypothetical protein [Methanobrevibacter sp.]